MHAVIRRRIVIRGLVQVVGFRIAAMSRDQVASHGQRSRWPRGARESGVEVSDEPPEGLRGFAVR
jgi:hypothetical protein